MFKQTYLILLNFVLSYCSVVAQEMDLLLQKDQRLSHTDFELALKWAENQRDLAISKNDNKALMQAYALIGNIYNQEEEQDQFGKAIEAYLNALRESRALKDEKSEAYILRNIAILYEKSEFYQMAAEYNEDSYKILERISDDKQILFASLRYAAESLRKYQQYSEAMEYYRQAESIFLNANDDKDKGLALIYEGMGDVFENQSSYDSALHYYDRANDILRFNQDDKAAVFILNKISNTYMDLEKYDRALEVLLETKSMFGGLDSNGPVLTGILNGIGDCYLKQGKYNEAISYLHEAEQKGEQAKEKNKLIDTYELLCEVYMEKGDLTNTIYYLNKQRILLNAKKKEDRRKELLMQGNIHDMMLAQNVSERNLTQLKIDIASNSRNIVIISAVLVCLILTFVTLIFYKKYQRKKLIGKWYYDQNKIITNLANKMGDPLNRISDDLMIMKMIHQTDEYEDSIKRSKHLKKIIETIDKVNSIN
ncbi:hypothetical protein QQ008_20515 [Fulvivirgaceae bacterium BMA10]|uniref:Tetratricopeptide repeat protein n=1 Tax=Splendidivirga corallicola TaxID=3051826 RepID=A0ABT8KST2_9BACT|nr:hypothetical protein [Fulvivirgaceae bacterium BMA10]